MTPAHPLRQLALQMARLGVLGFGGPAAHVALMRRQFVTADTRLNDTGFDDTGFDDTGFDDTEFADMIGLTNLIPGPNSTELAMHIGHRRLGGRGLIVAGVCFILPAVVMVSVLAALYERHGAWAALVDIRAGVLPVMLAIVADAAIGLRRTAAATTARALVALVAAVAVLLGANELLVLGSIALIGAATAAERVPFTLAVAAHPSVLELLWRFTVVGSVVYGSGYVLLAYLHDAFVDTGIVSPALLLDAITVGQATPGPVFTTATFLGWQIAGVAGAAVATLGVFGPSFLFVAVLEPLRRWIAQRPAASAALRAVTSASLGLMAAVAVQLADAAVVDPLAVATAVAAFALLHRRVDPTWLVLGGLAVGVLRALV